MGASSPEMGPQSLLSFQDAGVCYRLVKEPQLKFKDALLSLLKARPSRDFWALRHLNLELLKGQVLGLVGHNGAGKSTLCRLIAGILDCDEGRLDVRGRVTSMLGVGIGFQEELTGRDNVFLSGALLGYSRQDMADRFTDITTFADIGEFIDVPIKKWSPGMKARLGFAIGAHLQGDILLLDEVLGVGDEAFRKRCQKRLKELMEQAQGIVIVSHSTDMLSQLCTHVAWLDAGRLKQHGPAKEVLTQYRAQ